MDPAMFSNVRVWLMTVVGAPGRWAKGMFSAEIICIMDCIFIFYPVCLFIVINLNAFDVALMFFSHVKKKIKKISLYQLRL